MASSLPIHKSKSIGTYGVYTDFTDIRFTNFAAKTKCGKDQNIFEFNFSSADSIPVMNFDDVLFTNVEDSAVAFFFDPPQGWAVVSDCGEWPCTAPSNAVYKFNNV